MYINTNKNNSEQSIILNYKTHSQCMWIIEATTNVTNYKACMILEGKNNWTPIIGHFNDSYLNWDLNNPNKVAINLILN